MSALSKQELQIIQAFSSVDVPERIIRDSNIKELLHGMTAEQDAVQSDAQRLERLRQEKKDGNFIGNWWNDRDDKVQDAQIDLNKSIGRLTQKSSQLLIVNTAISKVLNDQQNILLEQQNILKQQTDTLEEQNRKILEQQKLLEKQQREINEANNGLMEAKGLTQEQAQQLVGCVKLVREAEGRISAANLALKMDVEQSLNASISQFLESVESSFTKQEQRYTDFELHITDAFSEQSQQAQTERERIAVEGAQFKSALEVQMESAIATLGQHREAFGKKLTSAFSTQSQYAQAELARFSSETAEFKTNIERQQQGHMQTVLEKAAAQDVYIQKLCETIKGVEQKHEAVQQEQAKALDAQLFSIHAEQQKNASSNRLAIAAIACLALASLGWQIAQHFALV